MKNVLPYVMACALLVCTTIAGAQTTVSFPSQALGKPAVLNAYLHTPEGTGPFPAVVLLHPCGGINTPLKVWASFLFARGYVALVVDSFTPRSITEVCTKPGISFADRVGDAFGALKYLQSLPHVDKNRIGLLGLSHGAITVLKTVSETTSFPLGDAPHFAAATALYPDCLQSEIDASVPLLIQSGERDDWTLAAPCQLKVAARNGEGYPVEINVYEGALHSFDNADVRYHYGARFRNVNKPQFCCGASLGYNHAAHFKAQQATEAFFARHLKQAASTEGKARSLKPAPTRDDVVQLVQAAKALAATQGKDKLIQLISSQDGHLRKRRQFLVLFDQNGVCLAHGQMPVAYRDSDFLAKQKDADGTSIIDVVRATLGKTPPWGTLRSQAAENDIYVERLDGDMMVVGVLIK